MKYKVGDKVRVKSKEWWNAQPKNESGSVKCGAETFNEFMASMCGKVVEISDVSEETYFIKEYGYNWTDEMFDDSYTPEKSILSEELIKDIAEVVKKHNLGISISENDGKLIIEPLKVDKEEDLPIDTPVMVADKLEYWLFRYYAGDKRCFIHSHKSKEIADTSYWNYIIPCDKFNFENPEESLKYNIVK